MVSFHTNQSGLEEETLKFSIENKSKVNLNLAIPMTTKKIVVRLHILRIEVIAAENSSGSKCGRCTRIFPSSKPFVCKITELLAVYRYSNCFITDGRGRDEFRGEIRCSVSDNLQVGKVSGNILEENHYYAFGLRIAAFFCRKFGEVAEGKIMNHFVRNGAKKFNELG